ncbi:MAG: helix-turn-helix domain-containing protein [Azospirillaceae bacterium]
MIAGLPAAGLDPLTLGLQLAGVLNALVLLAFVAARVPLPNLAAVPVLYALCLMAGFLAPLAEAAGAGPASAWARGAAWLGLGALPAATYLFVLQLLDGEVPARRHFHVLSLPALAVPAVFVATAAGSAPVCPGPAGSLCLAPRPVLALYTALAGLGVLLALMAVARPRFAALAGRPAGREKRWLILTIIALQVLLIGLDLGVTAGRIGGEDGLLVATILRLTFYYLVASAIFRVFPQIFLIRPVPAISPAEDEAEGEAAEDGPVDTGAPAIAGPPGAPAPTLDAEDRAVLDRLGALMTRDRLYREPGLGRRDLAEALGVPEHRLTRLVNVGLGRTVTEVINQHRVAEARDRLTRTDAPVTTIAFDVGFNSLASFNRVFKAATGLRPSDLRRRARSGDGEAAA